MYVGFCIYVAVVLGQWPHAAEAGVEWCMPVRRTGGGVRWAEGALAREWWWVQ